MCVCWRKDVSPVLLSPSPHTCHSIKSNDKIRLPVCWPIHHTKHQSTEPKIKVAPPKMIMIYTKDSHYLDFESRPSTNYGNGMALNEI